jgi:hypothetical protein
MLPFLRLHALAATRGDGTVQRLGGSHRFSNDRRRLDTTTKRQSSAKAAAFTVLKPARGRSVISIPSRSPPISGHSPIATRYDKIARNFLAAFHMVAALCWLNGRQALDQPGPIAPSHCGDLPQRGGTVL